MCQDLAWYEGVAVAGGQCRLVNEVSNQSDTSSRSLSARDAQGPCHCFPRSLILSTRYCCPGPEVLVHLFLSPQVWSFVSSLSMQTTPPRSRACSKSLSGAGDYMSRLATQPSRSNESCKLSKDFSRPSEAKLHIAVAFAAARGRWRRRKRDDD